MAAPTQYPTIFVNYPERHVIRNCGFVLDRESRISGLDRESLQREQFRWCIEIESPVLIVIGIPILRECLWPHLVEPTYRDRWIEHGEILRLTIRPPERPNERIDLVGVADLWNNYERITDLTGSRWVCRRADDFSQVPKMNLVAECPCKILFKGPNVDRFLANDYSLSEPSVLPLWRPDASMPAIRSPAMNWPQQCGVGGVG